ncbi:hypothetical protein NL108_012324 [Boleophthalmus pectinirostris]|nr:hypothetical protein NL108_012324 [Boleophthalmus pectinirostris]
MFLYRSLTWQRGSIAISLFLIFIQISTSLLIFAGEFIHTDTLLISPFDTAIVHSNETAFKIWYDTRNHEYWMQNNFLATVVLLSLYIPIVLVAFSLLAVVLAAYADDQAVMWLSMLGQGLSSLLLLVGILGFLHLHWTNVSWNGLTCWFFACVGAQVELALTATVTNRSIKRSDKIVDNSRTATHMKSNTENII